MGVEKQLCETFEFCISAPRYLSDRPPVLTASGNILRVDWTRSFQINGEESKFTVYVDQKAEYYGYATYFDILRSSQYRSKLIGSNESLYLCK